jgi:starch synthase
VKIAVVAAELAPWAKAGGLADVIAAMPPAFRRAGAQVSIVVPAYSGLARALDAHPIGTPVGIVLGDDSAEEFRVLEGRTADEITVYLVYHPGFFERNGIYGDASGDYADNLRRFAFFGRAAALIAATHIHADVVHAHDWHAAVTVLAARLDPQIASRLNSSAVIFTVHNLAFQGNFDLSGFPVLGLDARYLSPEWLEFYGRLNLLKGAVKAADGVSTVSPSYAREIIEDPELGFGLGGIFRARGDHFRGILNGADYATWDPAHDSLIAANYDASHPEGKLLCKSALRAEMGLSGLDGSPIVAMIARLTPQKGVDLVAECFDELMGAGIEFVVLGSGEPVWEEFFRRQQEHYPGWIGVRLGFDEALAHRIQAGADMFLMPSRFEPCGLTQMYAMRYGSAPIARATGGLRDTVRDFDENEARGTGFVFVDYRADAMLLAVRRAVSAFRTPERWRRLMRNTFAANFSWDSAAREYLKWFEEILQAVRATR